MTNAKFKSLKIGDKVTLARQLTGYHDFLWVGSLSPLAHSVPAHTVGTVGAVDVPPTVGNRMNFICVDFLDHPIEYTSYSGDKLTAYQRVACWPEDLI